MSDADTLPHEPPALTALRDYPSLLASVEPGVMQQAQFIAASADAFTGRQSILTRLHNLLETMEEGLITIEGESGSGVTTLLAHLAMHYPAAFWFANEDNRQGPAALAAQLIALHKLAVPLLPPAVQSDPVALEHFLAEVVAQSAPEARPLLIIDPPAATLRPPAPLSLALPSSVPAGVRIIYGYNSRDVLPIQPVARVVLPHEGDELGADQVRVAQHLACPAEWIETVSAAAQGNMWYLRLACHLLQRNLLTPAAMPAGLDALYDHWWQTLSADEQRLLLLVAATGEPMPTDLALVLLFPNGAQPDFDPWEHLQIVTRIKPATEGNHHHTITLAHESTRSYLLRQQAAALADAHVRIAELAPAFLGEESSTHPDKHNRLRYVSRDVQYDRTYMARQFARHAALGSPATRHNLLPMVSQRSWILQQERLTDSFAEAADDLAWELWGAASSGIMIRLARSAALAGTLVSMARSLSPDAAVAALHSAIEHYGREGGLKRVRAVVDQLPDVPAKGLILRRLGEACHALRMRTSAMRLLSQALDMEGQKLPAAWHEQREQLYNALAEKALELEDETVALAIAQRITHSERRGTLETQVVRWLLAHNQIERAREVALHIDHESLSAWAQAEVAVTLARTGQIDAAEEILTAIPSDTAWAWAQTALACMVAPTDEEAARRRIDQIESPAQHDRALAQLAHALVEADKDGDALDAAARIGDVAVRVAALLDLRLTLEGLVAMLALEQATAVIGKVERDMRVPLLSMLAASYAALGRSEQALHVANMAEGEEHERALSRVAVALAQRGDYAQALDIARNLADADEREWTLDELTRALAAGGHWQQAEALTAEIGTTHQRARTLADLAIARARAGEPLAGLQLAHRIVLVGTEYARAVTFIAPLLVAAGQSDIVLVVVEDQYLTSICIPAHTLSSAQVSRYLATVAIALAEHGDLDRATSAIMQRVQPLDQARAHVAIAQAAAPYDPDRAHAELGYALRAMLLGRDEAYRLLVQATPTFASLGGAALLNDIAAAIDEVDTW